MAPQIDLAQYLFTRLAQLGVASIHGVPGDYNLTALDYLAPLGLHWVGNANELNAGYAADGYARAKGGVAVLMTSFGVGELSAINAVGGAYAEKAAVVHVVGTPPRAAQEAGAGLHHSLGDGNFRVFADMYKGVTVAQANLTDAGEAPGLIDAVLRECVLRSRPVYVEMPTDMVAAKVAAPTAPIDLSVPGYDEAFEDGVVAVVLGRLLEARRPLILVDGFAARFDVRDEVNELVRVTGIPTLTTPFGKSLVEEALPNFCGVYSGLAGDPAHQRWVEGCDLVLRFGPLDSDINTFGFTAQPNPQVTVTFERHSVQMGNSIEGGPPTNGQTLSCKSLLRKLLKRLESSQLPGLQPFPENHQLPRELLKTLPPPTRDSHVDQYSFWLLLSDFLRPGDVLLTETGTSSYGGQSLVLPSNTTVINSSIWLSIGYTLAATQGVALAQREMTKSGSRPHGRTLLFEGEGSLQMSVQAFSDIIRNRLDVVVFVLNNKGYTVERVIHGFYAGYNDVQPWRHLEAPSFFGAPVDDPEYPVRTRRVNTWGELQDVLRDPGVMEGKGLNVVEVFMDMGDAPQSLVKFAKYVKKRNEGGL